MANISDLTITALNALASSPDGTMTLPDFSAHLETRHGSTEAEAADAQSAESKAFQNEVQALLSDLEAKGFAQRDATGGLIQVTPEGRAFVGR